MFALSTFGIHLQDFKDLPNEDELQQYADEIEPLKATTLRKMQHWFDFELNCSFRSMMKAKNKGITGTISYVEYLN